jgi:hypothetical protein
MLKQLPIFITSLLLSIYGLAQHCPFDATGMIALNVHAKGDSTQIAGLKISIQGFENSAGNFFWQNPPKTTLKGNVVVNDSAKLKTYNFPFAGNKYVLVCPYLLPKPSYKVKIEDVDGSANGGNFEAKTVEITQDNMFSLCGTYRLTSIPKFWKGNKTNFMPLNISLQLAKQGENNVKQTQ